MSKTNKFKCALVILLFGVISLGYGGLCNKSSDNNTSSGSSSETEIVIVPNQPIGTTFGNTGTSYSYSTGGSSSNLSHSIQYLFDWGDGTNSGWLAIGTTSASHSWSSANTYTVKTQARCATDTSVLSDWSACLSVSIDTPPLAETISTPNQPSGTTSGNPSANYSYSTGGASSNLGHSIQYLFDWGDGTNSGWLAVGTISASHSWSSANTYTVKAQARCAADTSVLSAWSAGLSVSIDTPPPPESVSTPNQPTGTTSGTIGTSYSYSTGGSSSNLGHSIQYQFDWGNGTYSGWLPVGITSATTSWTAGEYIVKTQARCATHTTVVSDWSSGLSVSIIFVNWAQKTPANKPSGRGGHAMVYDSVRGKVVLFGGVIGTDETWEWDGTNWSLKTRMSKKSLEFDKKGLHLVV